MQYFKEYNGVSEKVRISRSDALRSLLTTYRDNDMTRDMLTIPNRILTKFCTIHVKSDDGMIAIPGMYNLLPDDAEYDEGGKRKKNGRKNSKKE